MWRVGGAAGYSAAGIGLPQGEYCRKGKSLLVGFDMQDWEAHFAEKSRRRALNNLRRTNFSRMVMVLAGIAAVALATVIIRV